MCGHLLPRGQRARADRQRRTEKQYSDLESGRRDTYALTGRKEFPED